MTKINNGYSLVLLKRLEALREISDGDEGLTQRDICDRCGVSKSTAHRVTKSLVEKDVLQKRNGGYALTNFGKVITDEAAEYVSRVERAKEVKNDEDVLEIVLRTGIDVEHVTGGEVTRSTRERPLAPLARLAEVAKDAEEVLVLTNSVARESFEVGRKKVRRGEQNAEMVIDERVVESVRGTGWLDNELREDMRTGNLRIWVHEEKVPHQMAVLDGKLCYGVEDDNGMPVALLETEKRGAVKWAKATFEEYKENSRAFQPAEFMEKAAENADDGEHAS